MLHDIRKLLFFVFHFLGSTLDTTDLNVICAGPRHGEVPTRGESKSAAPPHHGADFESAAPPPGVNFENLTEVKFRDILLIGWDTGIDV